MDVYYLGPAGSFTHEAGLQIFTPEHLQPSSSIEDVIEAVKKKKGSLGVVPVENSAHGVVLQTLDRILEYKLRVIYEISIPIRQNLISKESSLKNIKTVYSHPHALAQTRRWLKQHLPKATLRESASTSSAVRMASNGTYSAAIGAAHAAQLYGLSVLSKNIHDSKDNVTRFWIITADTKTPSHTLLALPHDLPHVKTSCYIIIKDKIGALYELLGVFRSYHINFTSLQSRPLENSMWQYGFFIDILTDAHDPSSHEMFTNLAKAHPLVHIIGSYPIHNLAGQKPVIAHTLKRIANLFEQHTTHPYIQKEHEKATAFLKTAAVHADIKSTIATRFLVVPAIAASKYASHIPINDSSRERILLNKIKNYATLTSLYKTMLAHSKALQKQIQTGLEQKRIAPRDIKTIPLDDLRYYIDYCDALIHTLYESER